MTDYSDELWRETVDHRFGNSSAEPLTKDQEVRIRALREGARLFARHVIASVPPSWEREEAIRAIDNANSWAARAIVRNE